MRRVGRGRLRAELRRQPGWVLWLVLVAAGFALVGVLLGGSGDRFGGALLHYVVLFGAGALLLVAGALLLVRGRSGDGGR